MAPSISRCVILLEVTEENQLLPSISYNAPENCIKTKRKRSVETLALEERGLTSDLKFGRGNISETKGIRTATTYTIETFSMDQVEKQVSNEDCSGASNVTEPDAGAGKKIHYYSGNSFVEITKGIIHLYKENEKTVTDKTGKTAPSDMLVMLGIPSYISCRDLLQFLAPFQADFDHIKVIREATPNLYMALLKCKSQGAAHSIYTAINGSPYNSLEDEVCHVAYVSRVESMRDDGEIGLPLIGHTELPTCPVCLERMEESVDGILTILCNHTFHSACLSKWSDARCPVCRYVQTPEMVAKNMCFECGSSESLWICLICGHIGCGRYVHGHAYKHYCETSHCYAIQPDNNRVWDYAGDTFVHRLLQNKDGKVVEVANQRRSTDDCEDPEGKMDNLQLEFTYMLTTQLESQRNYFENALESQSKDFQREIEKLQLKLCDTADKKQDVESKLVDIGKDRGALEKKFNQVSQKLQKASAELREEKELNKHLQQDQHKWQEMVKKLETDFGKFKADKEMEIKELQEQLRDIMFYMEAKEKIEESPMRDEIVDGQVIVDKTESPSTSKGRRKKRN